MVAWDSRLDAAGDPAHVVPVQADLTTTAGSGFDKTQELSLSAPDSFLDNPSTVYPVTVDPTVSSVTRLRGTWIRNGDAATHNTDYKFMVGTYNGATSNAAATLMQWDTAPYNAKTILSASVGMYQYYGTTCSPKKMVATPLAQSWTAAATWANKPLTRTDRSEDASVLTNLGFSASCGDGWVTLDVANMVKKWTATSGGYPNYGMWVYPVGTNTTDPTYERRFCSMSPDVNMSFCNTVNVKPYLSINYNTTPATPSNVTVTPCVAPCTAPLVVQGTRPTFAAKTVDSDGGNWTLHAQVRPAGSSTTLVDAESNPVSVTATASVQLPTGVLTRGAAYEYRLGADDGVITTWKSTWTPMSTAQNTAPSAPAGVQIDPCVAPCSPPVTTADGHPTFSGPVSSDIDGDALTYKLQIRKASDSQTVVDATNQDPPAAGRWSIEVPADKLRAGTGYEYRVGAADAATTSWTSSWVPFSVGDAAPLAPQSLEISPCSPCANPATTSSLRPSFSGTSTDSDSRLLKYRVQVQQQGQTTVVADTTGAWAAADGKGTVRLDTNLTAGTAYEFRLGAVDANNAPAWSAWVPFATDGANPNVTAVPPWTVISSDTTWTRANSPYVLTHGMSVATGSTLTLEPGVVVKTSGYSITVAGTLNASGTKAAPIVFTSVKDDSEMGDSNGDGTASMPAPGDTGTVISFANPPTDADALGRAASVLRNVSIRYGGSGSAGGNGCWGNMGAALQYDSRTRLLMEHSEIINSYYNNLWGPNGIDAGYGSLTVRLSRFGATVAACDVAQAGWGDYYGNVFESGTNLGGLWLGTGALHASFEANWFLGCICLNADYGNYPTRSTWNFERNAFLGGFYNAWGTYPDDVGGN